MDKDFKKENKEKTEKKEVIKQNWEGQAQEYLAGWQRSKADYLNLKKEMEEDRKKAMLFSTIIFLEDFLPILSNLQKASRALEATNDAKDNGWATGIIHVTKQFDDFLEQKGVKRITTKDQHFDPSLHDAIDREESTTLESGMIIKEVEPGYTLHDSVITPAKVIVVK